MCCSPRGLKESDTTEPPNNNTILLLKYLLQKKKNNSQGRRRVLQVPEVFMALAVGMVPQVCLQALHVVDVKYLQVLIGQSYFNKETFLKATRFIQTLHKRRNSPYSVSCVMYYILYICGQ